MVLVCVLFVEGVSQKWAAEIHSDPDSRRCGVAWVHSEGRTWVQTRYATALRIRHGAALTGYVLCQSTPEPHIEWPRWAGTGCALPSCVSLAFAYPTSLLLSFRFSWHDPRLSLDTHTHIALLFFSSRTTLGSFSEKQGGSQHFQSLFHPDLNFINFQHCLYLHRSHYTSH